MSEMKIGMSVKVYEKPITLENFEEVGVIKTEPKPTGDFDINGNPLFHSGVRFGSEHTRYFRVFSVALNDTELGVVRFGSDKEKAELVRLFES